jgi:hypothetical protein
MTATCTAMHKQQRIPSRAGCIGYEGCHYNNGKRRNMHSQHPSLNAQHHTIYSHPCPMHRVVMCCYTEAYSKPPCALSQSFLHVQHSVLAPLPHSGHWVLKLHERRFVFVKFRRSCKTCGRLRLQRVCFCITFACPATLLFTKIATRENAGALKNVGDRVSNKQTNSVCEVIFVCSANQRPVFVRL